MEVIVILSLVIGLGAGVFFIIDAILKAVCVNIYQARKNMFAILECIGCPCALGGFIQLMNSGLGEKALPLAITGIGCVLVFAGFSFGIKIEQNEREISDQYFYFSGDDLIVIKRHPLVGSRLKVLERTEFSLRYDPLKIHVGGASVGGVFTGGVYTTGGKTYLQPGKGTGEFVIYYQEGKDESTMRFPKKIYLQGDALKDAQRSSAFVGESCLDTEGSKGYCLLVKSWLARK